MADAFGHRFALDAKFGVFGKHLRPDTFTNVDRAHVVPKWRKLACPKNIIIPWDMTIDRRNDRRDDIIRVHDLTQLYLNRSSRRFFRLNKDEFIFMANKQIRITVLECGLSRLPMNIDGAVDGARTRDPRRDRPVL